MEVAYGGLSLVSAGVHVILGHITKLGSFFLFLVYPAFKQREQSGYHMKVGDGGAGGRVSSSVFLLGWDNVMLT